MPRHSEDESLFEYICGLAEAKAKETLNYLLQGGVNIHAFDGEYNPIMFLAKQGSQEAVEFLIDEFKANIKDAVIGAIRGKQEALIHALIRREVKLNHDVQAVACSGNRKLTLDYLSRGANINNAIWGAARGGDIKLTHLLLDRGGSLSYAVHAAACGGHEAFTYDLIKLGGCLYQALWGSALGGYRTMVIKLIGYLVRVRGEYYNGAIYDDDAVDEIFQETRKRIISKIYAIAIRSAALGGHRNLFVELLNRYGQNTPRIDPTVTEIYSGRLSIHLHILSLALNEIKRKGKYTYFWSSTRQFENNDFLGLDESIWLAAVRGDRSSLNKLLRIGIGAQRAGLDYAVLGAAQAGHQTLVEELLVLKASSYFAAFGAAQRGHFRLINQMMIKYSDIQIDKYLVCGAASGGHLTCVEYLNQRYFPTAINCLYGAAQGGQVGILNYITSPTTCRLDGMSQKRRQAYVTYFKNFASSNHSWWAGDLRKILINRGFLKIVNNAALLRYLSFIENPSLQKFIVDRVKYILNFWGHDFDERAFLKKISKLSELISENKVSFNEAKYYLETKPAFWLCLGAKFPGDICLKIWSYASDIDQASLSAIFNLANERIFNRVMKTSTTGFAAFFKFKKTIDECKNSISARYLNRQIF